MIESEGVGSREEKKPEGAADQVRMWLDAVSLSSDGEDTWRKRAENAVEIYRAGSDAPAADLKSKDRTFNILHSNVETIVPAIYNSAPVPDVRRRFGDDDPVGDEVCDLLERCISYSIDNYDYHATLNAAVKDMELPGRGVTRVRYVPYSGEDGTVADEDVTCEHVQWRNFRVGPARTWADVPWVAFEVFLTREQLVALSPDGKDVELDCEVEGLKDKGDGANVPEIFKRARVWEIWDKEAREVLFIAESKRDKPLRVEPDPLQLSGFFPVPRPLYAIETSDSLTPIVPYDVYKDQAEELETVSRRIMGLVEALKARGAYDGRLTEMGRVVQLEDGELVAVENAAAFQGADLNKAIAWWPIEVIAATLEKLYLQRDQIKQTIYEVTGIADILRGETDANETATAQQIKSQWGSLRIRRKQAEVQRYARDLFRLKAEIIASKFSWETITMMANVQYLSAQDKQALQQQAQQIQQAVEAGLAPPPPPEVQQKAMQLLKRPAREEIEQLLRSPMMRGFRIDIESDSTIRADLTRNQQMMATFMQGVGEFGKVIGPAVMQGFIPQEIAATVFAAFARNFRLGKQAEDAIENLADQARENPQPKQPSPEEIKAQADQQKMQMEAQFKQEEHQLKLQMMQSEMQFKREELQMRREELALEFQAHQQKMQMDQQAAQQEAAMRQFEMQNEAQFSLNQHAMDMQASQEEHAMERDAMFENRALEREAAQEKHKFGMQAMKDKARFQKQQQRAKSS